MEEIPEWLERAVLWTVGGAIAVAGAAVALVKSLPLVRTTNGQKAFQDGMRRDVDRLIARTERHDEAITEIKVALANKADRT